MSSQPGQRPQAPAQGQGNSHHQQHHHQHQQQRPRTKSRLGNESLPTIETPSGGNPGTPGSGKPVVKIGPYIVKQTLGEGSFGKVKLAIHEETGQKVALKIINRKKLLTKDMAGRIDREIEFLQLLRHPHIIKLYTVVTNPTEIIMVIEYAARELFDYIVQHGRMTEDNARRFFQQIISAVEYCHRHKIAHRDLKPENLLLDEQLNVKIADFGLSNIMHDGSFLKTSCGSPNYAAPEVINGKLYAGPEVDVWSCGVILYVLLCGRLPFDDEYIPALFKKIAQGQYTIPGYLSQGAANLLRKMLIVNPLQRITVDDIRKDPWFVKDLPDYLKPPKQEFYNTGVDYKEILRQSNRGDREGRNRDRTHEAKLHDQVVGKLDRIMGYGRDEVHEALVRDSANPIKDAYNLVRENQIIANSSRNANPDGMKSFLAQSPPPWTSNGIAPPGTPPPFSLQQSNAAPSPGQQHHHQGHQRHHSRSSSPLVRPVDAMTLAPSPSPSDSETDIGHIAILPSSLPQYHRAYMEAKKRGAEKPAEEIPVGGPVHLGGKIKPTMPIKSSIKPSPLTPLSALEPVNVVPDAAAQKKKPVRWQFGIRSRNLPLEAIACIYRALEKAGAEWQEIPRQEESDDEDNGSDNGSPNGSDNSLSRNDHDDDDEDAYSGDERNGRSSSPAGSRNSTESDLSGGRDERDPPKDPWCIKVRWRKDRTGWKQDQSIYIYMTVQLYQLERAFYLVDFMCTGYELIGGPPRKVRTAGDDDDERVNSPFPFLEVAGDLIIQLAEGSG